MNCRPSAALAVLVLCAACNFDPSGGSGGPGGGIGGDTDDGGVTGGSDASSVLDDDAAPAPDAEPLCGGDCPGTCEPDGTCHIFCGRGGEGGGGGGGLLPGEEPPPCGAVTCPAGIPCYVHCLGQDSCEQPVDCAQATACRIDCTDDRACAGQLTCGTGACEIHCDGSDSCGGGLDCQDSCFCDLSCQGDSSCNPQAVCPAGFDADPDCKTSGSGCNDRDTAHRKCEADSLSAALSRN